MKIIRRYCFVFALTLLAACAPSPSNTLLIKQPQTLDNLRVVFLKGAVVAERAGLDAIAYSALEKIGYFDMGKRVVALAPGLLNKRGVRAEAAALPFTEDLPVDAIKGVPGAYSSVLVLTFGRSSISRRNARGAELNLEAELSDVVTTNVVWRGNYPIVLENATEANSKLDKARVGKVLEQIFADMTAKGLLPPG